MADVDVARLVPPGWDRAEEMGPVTVRHYPDGAIGAWTPA